MSINRREFLKRSLTIAGTSLLSGGTIAHAGDKTDPSALSTGNTANERNWRLWVEKSETLAPEKYGVLVADYKMNKDEEVGKKIVQIYAYKKDFIPMLNFLEENEIDNPTLLQLYSNMKDYIKEKIN